MCGFGLGGGEERLDPDLGGSLYPQGRAEELGLHAVEVWGMCVGGMMQKSQSAPSRGVMWPRFRLKLTQAALQRVVGNGWQERVAWWWPRDLVGPVFFSLHGV